MTRGKKGRASRVTSSVPYSHTLLLPCPRGAGRKSALLVHPNWHTRQDPTQHTGQTEVSNPTYGFRLTRYTSKHGEKALEGSSSHPRGSRRKKGRKARQDPFPHHAVGTRQELNTDPHLPYAGSRKLAHGVAGAGQAGQEQARPRGRVPVAVQQVFHEPAAEQGRGALELHPLHLKLHTWRGGEVSTAAVAQPRMHSPPEHPRRAGRGCPHLDRGKA